MAIQPPIYTGRDTGVRLNDGGRLERASTAMSNKMMAASQAQAQFSKEERDAFLEALDTETVALMSEKLLSDQGTMIEEYNKKWGQRYQDTNGRLSMQDKVEMTADKKRLEGWQKQSMLSQERWKTDKAQVLRNPAYYDKDTFYDAEKAFLETGEYPVGALQAKPMGLSTAIANQRTRVAGLKGRQETRIEKKGGVDWRVPYESTADLEDPENETLMRQWTQEMILSDERVLRGVLRDFNGLSAEEKKAVLDVDKDGVVSPTERDNENPIIQWAVDNNWKNWAVENFGTPTKVQSGSGSGGTKEPVWQGEKYTRGATSVQNFGTTTLSTYHDLGGINKDMNIPAGSVIFSGNGEREIGDPKGVEGAKILGYDENREMLVVSTDKDLEVGTIWQDNNVGIPIHKLPPEYMDLEITTAEGIKKIGDLAGASPSGKVKIKGF